ncbi:hypothetical protein [Halalkalibacter urbisdiaboli]|uniref:hypothetical protein n=1 Tax=Halalkalibacter urbisdiaboli TaxID=1960589 RepID=UPI000B440965|nr:hypothetical protein [Halalkalibacter urbisdiaboli]
MLKKISMLVACLLTFFVIPFQVALAAGGGGEETAHAEPSGMLITLLGIMSFATLIVMIYYSFRDNG